MEMKKISFNTDPLQFQEVVGIDLISRIFYLLFRLVVLSLSKPLEQIQNRLDVLNHSAFAFCRH